MAKLLLGKEVNEKLNARITARCEALKARGVNPTLAIVRCGERPTISAMSAAPPSGRRPWGWRWRSSCCPRM